MKKSCCCFHSAVCAHSHTHADSIPPSSTQFLSLKLPLFSSPSTLSFRPSLLCHSVASFIRCHLSSSLSLLHLSTPPPVPLYLSLPSSKFFSLFPHSSFPSPALSEACSSTGLSAARWLQWHSRLQGLVFPSP